MTALNTDAQQTTRPPRGRFWLVLPVALLAANFLGVGVLVWVSSSDRSFFVEPDYHQKALRWDDRMAQRRQNERLGWRVEVLLQRLSADRTRVEARIVDGKGVSVTGATVRIATFHKARAARVLKADLVEGSQGGTYVAALRMWRRGLWEIRLTAQKGERRFGRRFDRDL